MPPVLLLSLLLHVYVGWRLVPDLATIAGLPAAAAFGVLIAASALLMPMTLWARRVRRQPLADRLAWGGSLAMGLFSSLFVLTLLRDLVLLLAAAAQAVRPGLLPGLVADLPPASAAAVALLGLGGPAWGLLHSRRAAAGAGGRGARR